MSIEVEARGEVRVIRIARPEQRNALDRETVRKLTRAMRAVGRDRTARGIVLTGSGAVFAAGGDLRELSRVRGSAGARGIAMMGVALIDAWTSTGLPVIAAVNGDAYGGGCELAAACDYRVVDERARLHWVQSRFAVTTAWGGTARVVNIVGPGTATRWLLTARPVDALEAQRTGFADEVAPFGTSVDAACAFVDATRGASRATVRRLLELIRATAGRSPDESRGAELRAFARSWISREHHEAVAKFLSRDRARQP